MSQLESSGDKNMNLLEKLAVKVKHHSATEQHEKAMAKMKISVGEGRPNMKEKTASVLTTVLAGLMEKLANRNCTGSKG